MAYTSTSRRDPDEEYHDSHGKKTFKCCCCRMTKARLCKIVLLATLGPILLFGLIVGIYILVVRLSYNPPPSQFSSANDTMAFLQELEAELQVEVANSTTANSTDGSVARAAPSLWGSFNFQTSVNPPWSDCSGGNALANVRVVSMSACELDEDSRCIFPIEVDWIVEVAFTMKQSDEVYDSPSFHACGKAVYLGTPCRTQPFKYANPCNSSNLECPLQGGKSYLYRNIGGVHQKDLPVKIVFNTVADTYLRMRSTQDPKSPLIFCVRIPSLVKVE